MGSISWQHKIQTYLRAFRTLEYNSDFTAELEGPRIEIATAAALWAGDSLTRLSSGGSGLLAVVSVGIIFAPFVQ